MSSFATNNKMENSKRKEGEEYKKQEEEKNRMECFVGSFTSRGITSDQINAFKCLIMEITMKCKETTSSKETAELMYTLIMNVHL